MECISQNGDFPKIVPFKTWRLFLQTIISRSMLKLKGLELERSGVYRVQVENKFEVKWENFTLIVTEPPQVKARKR